MCTKGERPRGRGTRLLPSAGEGEGYTPAARSPEREVGRESGRDPAKGGFDRENASVGIPLPRRTPTAVNPLAPLPRSRSLSFIVATEEDQYEPRGGSSNATENGEPNPRARNNLNPKPGKYYRERGSPSPDSLARGADIFPGSRVLTFPRPQGVALFLSPHAWKSVDADFPTPRSLGAML